LNISSVVNASKLYPGVPDKAKEVEKPTIGIKSLADSEIKNTDQVYVSVSEQTEEFKHESREKKPWLTHESKWPSLHDSDKKQMYLFDMTVESIGRLRDIRFTFKEFSERLKDLRPDIANTNYGFTLDENAKIKILDGRNKLSEADKLWLTDEINTFKDFGTTIHAHAKALMTLVDHREDFGGKYNLNRHNFQSVIDYGEILNMTWENQHEKFIKMVYDYSPRKSESLIDTHA